MDDRAKLLPIAPDDTLAEGINQLLQKHTAEMTAYLTGALKGLLDGAEGVWPYRVHVTLIATPMTPPLLPDGRLEVATVHILDSFGQDPNNLMQVANMVATFAMQRQAAREAEDGPKIILPPGVH